MGKRFNRKRKVEERKKRSQQRKEQIPDDMKRGYKFNPQYSAIMEAYYAYQGLFNVRREGDAFVECSTSEEKEIERTKYNNSIRSILPASFRLGQDCHPLFRSKFLQELDDHAGKPIEITLETNSNIPNIPNINIANINIPTNNDDKDNINDGSSTYTKMIPPVRPIPFIPHGYQLSVDRRTIRRNASLSDFHEWLKIQTNSGFITRQETVSMIPPIVLGVESHHAVLDMCAAPGSKTSQMLEIVSEVPSDKNLKEPQGFVVANDSDPKRAYMLINNLRRINSPATFVGSVDAQFFPQLKGFNNTDNKNEGLFDRVLCDVPCSGDGTMRKNPGIWKSWSPLGSLALHPLQIAIAMKGATLTKVGGYICYSTCSMNPIENEAVVAEILRRSKGSLVLVDKRPDMPGLMARPGWSNWKVMATLKRDKNKEKKNSPKMIQKRKEWDEKLKKEQEKTKDKDDDTNDADMDVDTTTTTTTTTTTCAEKTAETESKMQEEEKDNKKEDEEQPKADPTTIPLDWNEDSLKQKALDLGILMYDKFEDVPDFMSQRVKASCFPPTPEEAESFHLERTMRCLPHDMNTGGFFIALFQKVAPVGVKARDRNRPNPHLSKETETAAAAAAEAETETSGNKEEAKASGEDSQDENNTSQQQQQQQEQQEIDEDNEESMDLKSKKGKDKLRGRGATRGDAGNSNFIPAPAQVVPELVDFYGLGSEFPTDQLMAREEGNSKMLVFITKAIKEGLIDRGIQRITVINSGLRCFERNTKECDVGYRVVQEGIHMLVPYMAKRKVVADFKDFVNCLRHGAIYLNSFASEELQKQIKDMSVGSFVVVLKGHETDIGKKMFLVMWRCRGDAINCLVSQIEIDGTKSKLRAIAELHGIEYDPNESPPETKPPPKKNDDVHTNEDESMTNTQEAESSQDEVTAPPCKKEKLDEESV